MSIYGAVKVGTLIEEEVKAFLRSYKAFKVGMDDIKVGSPSYKALIKRNLYFIALRGMENKAHLNTAGQIFCSITGETYDETISDIERDALVKAGFTDSKYTEKPYVTIDCFSSKLASFLEELAFKGIDS